MATQIHLQSLVIKHAGANWCNVEKMFDLVSVPRDRLIMIYIYMICIHIRIHNVISELFQDAEKTLWFQQAVCFDSQAT